MRDPLVTIVTPSFNQGRFIRATIESVLNQDYPRIEYIVMDGGSTDDSAAVVADYADRLTYVSESDRGQAHAINKGFAMARGEIVAWINSDDVLYPGAVSRAVAELARSPALGAVYGDGDLMDEAGVVTGPFSASEPFNLWKLIHLWDYVLQQSVYFRRSAVVEIGYLDEHLDWALDWDLLIRIGSRWGLGYIPHPMGALREYGAAKTFSGGHRRFRELVAVMRRYGHHRYPPGYFLYGYDTYRAIALRALRRVAPEAVVTHAGNRLQRLAAPRLGRLLAGAQGVQPGGWATDCVEWMVPACHARVLLRGCVPEIRPELEAQSLSISAGGRAIAEFDVPFGEFSVEFDLPAPAAGDRLPLIVVRARRCAAASRVGLSPDHPPVAFLLREFTGVG